MNKTTIEWTEATWNPITGCSKVSDGCKNCYAERFAKRLKAMGNPRYLNGFDVTIHKDLFEEPLKWKSPKKIFVNSMSDLFHEEIEFEIIEKLFSIMNQANWHTFQILTKRSERLLEVAPRLNWSNNIWMGVSIENMSVAKRAEDLKKTNAFIKYISAEPLLGSLDGLNINGIDWLIVGGESGYGFRPIEEQWVLELQDNAIKNNVPFFFKQWGGAFHKKNGALLKGREYKEYPKP